MEPIIFLNGKFLPSSEAKLSVFDPGFLYGFGLFETMRSYNKKIVYFDSHLKRIATSCDLIGIQFPYSITKAKAIIQKAVALSGFFDLSIRLTVWKLDAGAGFLIAVKKYEPYARTKYRNGFRACVGGFRQNENSLYARLKTIDRLSYQLVMDEAKNRKFDEAIILNSRGYIAEGTRSNLFCAKDGELFTPALECGCLEGITRKAIIDAAKKNRIQISERKLTLGNVYKMDEAFLTNSLMGIMPLISIENRAIGNGKHNTLTRFFKSAYDYL